MMSVALAGATAAPSSVFPELLLGRFRYGRHPTPEEETP